VHKADLAGGRASSRSLFAVRTDALHRRTYLLHIQGHETVRPHLQLDTAARASFQGVEPIGFQAAIKAQR
jgi:hypothetical protein